MTQTDYYTYGFSVDDVLILEMLKHLKIKEAE